MSTDPLSTPLPPSSGAATGGVGLGYGIAIAVGILVLVSTIMLTSYFCVRVKGGSGSNRRHPRTRPTTTTTFSSSSSLTTTTSRTPPLSTGLDVLTIESFPKFTYAAGCHTATTKPIMGPCPICLAEYKDGEVIRCVPECEHCFHVACVDEWLRVSATCPLCRSSPVPSAAATPVATPLSELIPLAMHAR